MKKRKFGPYCDTIFLFFDLSLQSLLNTLGVQERQKDGMVWVQWIDTSVLGRLNVDY